MIFNMSKSERYQLIFESYFAELPVDGILVVLGGLVVFTVAYMASNLQLKSEERSSFLNTHGIRIKRLLCLIV